MTRRVLIVGDIMTDVIVKPSGSLVRGSDRPAVIRTLPGGSAANQAAWLARFGLRVTLVAKVGRADAGRYEALMQGFGVDPALAVSETVPSGMLVTIVDPDGERSFYTDRGANDTLDPEDLSDELLREVSLLQISGYALQAERSRRAVRDLMARAKRRHIPIGVDPASVTALEEIGPANFLAWTSGAALCFPNEAEAVALTGTTDPEMQFAALANYYGLCIVKRGDRGAETGDARGQRLMAQSDEAVACVDTTGAGDAFLAGFVAAYLNETPLDGCLRDALAAGSLAVTTFGGQPTSGREQRNTR